MLVNQISLLSAHPRVCRRHAARTQKKILFFLCVEQAYPSLNTCTCCEKTLCTGASESVCVCVWFALPIKTKKKKKCAECYLQVKSPHHPAQSECPFCKKRNFMVKYTGIRSAEEREREEEVCCGCISQHTNSLSHIFA